MKVAVFQGIHTTQERGALLSVLCDVGLLDTVWRIQEGCGPPGHCLANSGGKADSRQVMIAAAAPIAALEPSKRRSHSVIWPACQAEPSCNRPPHPMGRVSLLAALCSPCSAGTAVPTKAAVPQGRVSNLPIYLHQDYS
jgi:hypothetical protein